jgi:hypothetical protein
VAAKGNACTSVRSGAGASTKGHFRRYRPRVLLESAKVVTQSDCDHSRQEM